MRERVRHILIKEFIQVFRDPRMRFTIFVPPLMQMILLGYAVTTDVKHVALGVHDLDHTVASRELVARFVGSGYFDVVEHPQNENAVQDSLDRSRVRAILRIPRGFQERWESGRTAPLQLLVDGTDSNTASVVLQYSSRITAQLSEKAFSERLQRRLGRPPQLGSVQLQTRAWFNENLESRLYYVPGVIAMIVTMVTLMLSSMAMVREKEMGTIEQIMVTPIRPMEFILGKTLPFALISFMDVLLISLVGIFWFQVPLRGSPLWLFFGTALYLMSTLGIGLLISSVSQTQQQVMMTTTFFYMPAVLLSGLVFPIANMPQVVQWLTFLNPMRYFLVIIRGIFLKGVGPAILWPEMLALAILGITTLWMAARQFRKTLA
ncbi:MAG: ABC transporter permease [Acidobacteria bacterium RIFCSPLOWO2_02_FULL_59_13]|nr:MAG: ABC transporter permease [Acidobacteria bacterium RIFCSPLOWO2_02_FULL_59_13]